MRVVRKQSGRNGWLVDRVWKGRIEKNKWNTENFKAVKPVYIIL